MDEINVDLLVDPSRVIRLPHSCETERLLCGAALVMPEDQQEEVATYVPAKVFFDEWHRQFWSGLKRSIGFTGTDQLRLILDALPEWDDRKAYNVSRLMYHYDRDVCGDPKQWEVYYAELKALAIRRKRIVELVDNLKNLIEWSDPDGLEEFQLAKPCRLCDWIPEGAARQAEAGSSEWD